MRLNRWNPVSILVVSLLLWFCGQAQAQTPGTDSFVLTGSMNTERFYYTATLLNNGKVLIVGGMNDGDWGLTGAELYDPALGTFTPTGSLNTGRTSHTATLLNNGKVLIVGGQDSDGDALPDAELYDPAAGTFSAAGNLNIARHRHTATLLNNGKVLIVGGYDSNWGPLDSAELYDPVAWSFTSTGTLSTSRAIHAATLLNNGTVLIAGGMDINTNALANADLYDPASGIFTATGSLNTGRFDPGAMLLNNGTVLITGGYGSEGLLVSAELYDPSVGTFTATGSMNTARYFHTATLLTNGTGLVAGGWDSNWNSLASAELYDPSGTFAFTGDLNTERDTHTAVLLNSGAVLIAGGYDESTGPLTAAELYQPSALTPPGLVSIAVTPLSPSIPLATTQQFIATGTFSDNSTQTLASVMWSSSDNAVATITSDSTNHGHALAVAVGSATVTACAGAVCGSTTLTVVPPALTSIAIIPEDPTVTAGLSVQFYATGTFTDGHTQNLTDSVTWTSETPLVATIDSAGLATAFAGGSTTIQASLGSVSASTTLSVPPPVLLSLTVLPAMPGTLVGGTVQFTATGTFAGGSTQDLTTSASWSSSDTSVATISATGLATGIASGSATITATVGAITKTVILRVAATATPPAITASVSPFPDGNGWNNMNVTVTFTCTAGSSTVTNCPAPQVVSSEGANQVVSGTVTDANGLTATASVTLKMDKTPPVLTVTSPAEGAVFSSASVTIAGTVADSLSGASAVTCNGASAALTGSDFSCDISLNPGINVALVRATDVAGNVAGANIHMKLDAPLPPPASLQITPGDVNMVVDETQQFTAVDEHGHPRTDATWTVSDTALATITTESSPVLTAVAVGQVTLTASVGSVSAQVQVHILSGTSLPFGTTRWSVPPSPGFTPAWVVQAEPVDGAPDLYSVEKDASGNVNVRGLTQSGQQLWSTQIPVQPPSPWLYYYFLGEGTLEGVGDGDGGLLLINYNHTVGPALDQVLDLDPQTGTVLWFHSWDRMSSYGPAVGPDGKIYFWEEDTGSTPSRVQLVVVDGKTGITVARYPVGGQDPEHHLAVTNSVVGPDGTVSSAFMILDSPLFSPIATETVSLLQVSPGGDASIVPFKSFTGDLSGPFAGLINLIPNGEGGLLLSWSYVTTIAPHTGVYYVSNISAGGGSTDFAFPYQVAAQVLGENNLAYGIGGGGATAFDKSTGAIVWRYLQPGGYNPSIMRATDGVGLLIDSLNGVVQLDSSGVASTPIIALEGTTPFDLATFISYLPGESVATWVGVINGRFSLAVGPSAELSPAEYPMPQGNPENQKAAKEQAIPVKFTLKSERNLNDGSLFFTYTWSSSTGKQSDLASCKVGESVFYPNYPATPYTWPLPMSDASTNPTTIRGSASNAGLWDRNWPPAAYQQPYYSAHFDATQRFWWTCPYYNNEDLNYFVPDITISRKVFMDTDSYWKYQINKSGYTNTVRLPNQ